MREVCNGSFYRMENLIRPMGGLCFSLRVLVSMIFYGILSIKIKLTIGQDLMGGRRREGRAVNKIHRDSFRQYLIFILFYNPPPHPARIKNHLLSSIPTKTGQILISGLDSLPT